MPTSATWNSGTGNWFDAARWDEPNPDAPPPLLHHVPGADNDVNIPDQSGIGTPFTISYNGSSSVHTLTMAGNGTFNITGGSLTTLNGGGGFGTLSLAAGATFAVGAGTFSLNNANLSGTLSGAGTFRQVNGTFEVNAGVSITVGTWLLTYQVGSGTVSTTNLNTDLTFNKVFQLQQVFGNYPILNLNSHILTLAGTSTLDGVINGPGTLKITGSGTIAGGTIEDGAKLEVASTLQQTGSFGLDGTLQIDAGGSHTITAVSTIADDGASLVLNNGTFSVTAAGGSRVSGNLTNNGTLSIASGAELILGAGTETLNGTVTGAGTLTFGFAHGVILNTTALSVGSIVVAGGNGGGTVTLAKNLAYGGSFNVADTGVFDLNGKTFTLSGTSAFSSGNIDGGGKLRIEGTATISGVNIGSGLGVANAVNAAALENAGTINQTGTIGVNGTVLNTSGHAYTITNASNITGIGSLGLSFTNNGLFRDNASGLSFISGNFTNNATVVVASGAELVLNAGTHVLNGAVSGAGQLSFGFAHTATLNTTTLTVGSIYINGGNGGGSVALGKDISYANTFTFADQFGSFALNGFTLTLSGTSSFQGSNLNGGGTLKITGSSTLGFLGVGGGSGTAATIENAGTIIQTGDMSLHGTVLNDAGHTYQIKATRISNDGATFINHGTLSVTTALPSTLSEINATFTSDGAISIASGASLKLSGTSTLGGTVSGAGSLTLAGTSTVNTAITTASLNFSGNTTLGVNMIYGGTFSFDVFDTLNLNSHNLILGGTSTLTSGFNTINGTGTLKITGTATVGGISIGSGAGAVLFENAGTVNQIGGISLNGTILNDAGKTYTLAAATVSNNSAIFKNNGILNVTTALPVANSEINATFTNNGTLSIGTGASLRLSGTSTLGGTVSGAGSLILAGTSTVNTAIATAALNFSGNTTLGVNMIYGGTFSFDVFDTLNLNSHNLILGGTSTLTSGFNTINGTGTLKITGTATVGGISIGSGAGAVLFENAGTVNQIGGISLNGTILNDAGKIYTLAAATVSNNSAIFKNNGILNVTTALPVANSEINATFTNNGTLSIGSGASLRLSGTNTLGGTINGAGGLVLGGTSTVNTAVSTAALDVIGTATLGVNLSYAGIFGLGAFATVNLNGHTLTLGGASSFTTGFNSVNGTGTLKITGSSVLSGVTLGSASGAVTLENAGSIHQSGGITLNGTLLNDAGHTYTLEAGNIDGNGAIIINNGTFEKSGNAGSATVSPIFTNNGLVVVDDGTLIISNMNNIGVIQGVITQSGNKYTIVADAIGHTTLTGGTGNNTLNGSAGDVTMSGGGGNDRYIVNSVGDVVKELPGGGTADEVRSFINYSLGAQIEKLTLLGSTAVNGYGNTLANVIIGNGAQNVVDGKTGADSLTGGGGADIFGFSTALGSGNVDHIVDFSVADDTIRLAKSVFATLATGVLPAFAFKDTAGGVAVDANDRIIYNHNTGMLSYDTDGSGAAAAVQFAKVDNHAVLTAADFVIV